MLAAAEQWKRTPYEFMRDILIEENGAVGMVQFGMCEENLKRFYSHPLVTAGSDGNAVAPYGILGRGKPHPRFYGTFARVLGRYVRELGLLSLPQGLYKMTGGSAAALGLTDRGLLREGYRADVCIFDPHTIVDRATYADPHQYAVGVSTVIVNGVVVIDAGEHTGQLPGRVLRRGRDFTTEASPRPPGR